MHRETREKKEKGIPYAIKGGIANLKNLEN